MTKKASPPRMSQNDLRKFVLDLCDGKVFTHRDCHNERDISLVFMVLAFMDMKTYDLESIGLIYEYYSEAGPMSMNGMPMFMSCRLMHKDDWEIARAAAKRELERRKDLPLTMAPEPKKDQVAETMNLFEEKGPSNV